MIGNFTSTILSSMDRWFVKFLLELYDFAQYSFAVSVESVVNVAITPITVTLYNYFCKHKDDYQLEKDCKAYVTVFSTLVVAAAFPAKFIIEVFLTEYTKSVGVIFYLFAAQIIYIVVKSVYVNLYKAKHKQRKYFTKLCVVIASGFLFNCICYLLLKSKESFAIGTLLSAIVWLILSELDFRELRYSCIEYLYILAEILLFVFCGTKLSSVFGMLVYLFVTGVLDMVVFRATIVKLVQLIRLRFQEGIK